MKYNLKHNKQIISLCIKPSFELFQILILIYFVYVYFVYGLSHIFIFVAVRTLIRREENMHTDKMLICGFGNR